MSLAGKITARRLADFLSHASEHETIRQQRIRDLEAKAILEVIAGSVRQDLRETANAPEPTALAPLAPTKPVDFATLTAFEEFQ
ncbi:hypothetical protein KSC_105850 [Ktedonobacter sp. SOSP1-52]|uniref:hypothetical protein n=1 Tax=Ktedonobacter sp. SOSP1-52 TaxID=2778366 RepID=UPI00191539F9|nr:hypothetical protein [Ktedonobacter sp. SOSP1-52]GHO71693.1 hypothetical protein KSC_105850 [Ktedonobacter sp. SOSP1-52]